MATEANNKATEAKATVDNLSNAFSNDARGAYVGDKTKQFVWVNKDGVWLMDGKNNIANFTEKTVSLASNKLIIRSDMDVVTYDFGARKDVKMGTTLYSDNIGLTTNDTLFAKASNIHLQIPGSTALSGIYLMSDKMKVYPKDGQVTGSGEISYKDLVKMMKFTSWTTLQDDGVCRVRYCIRGGMLYLDCYLAAGYSTRTTTTQMPKELLPAIEGYYSLGTQTGNNTAKIWIGSANGNDGHIYFYNWSSGYATGIIPILPKSME